MRATELWLKDEQYRTEYGFFCDLSLQILSHTLRFLNSFPDWKFKPYIFSVCIGLNLFFYNYSTLSFLNLSSSSNFQCCYFCALVTWIFYFFLQSRHYFILKKRLTFTKGCWIHFYICQCNFFSPHFYWPWEDVPVLLDYHVLDTKNLYGLSLKECMSGCVKTRLECFLNTWLCTTGLHLKFGTWRGSHSLFLVWEIKICWWNPLECNKRKQNRYYAIGVLVVKSLFGE